MLEVQGISLGYGSTLVLEGVDLRVEAGEFVSLVGPSGSGKSTLLRTIAGLLTPQKGSIRRGCTQEEIGFLFQEDALLPWRTARDNVALGLRIRGWPKEQAWKEAEAWLERLGLEGLGNRFPHQLSGGQRKRVALAQVLVLKPRLLLMDEPFASLDAILRTQVTQDLLALVEEEGITVLLVTHDLEEALSLSDRVYLLSQGPRARIVQEYRLPFPRPRDPIGVKADPRFGTYLQRLWQELKEVSLCAAP
ncbi:MULTISPECIES: ABC transporter ATP-binding protein [Thermus]|uniref:ABC transporter ATP-binding protein n=2 Tax=Thermus TaxID=270 RepID=A0A430RZM4_THESC|nr:MULTISPECIES: ABC transporter ATP-binding protein [Thermus]QWK21591.1 MAG: ABC transporter ATP-binding protein [Thermus antranikianii]RTH26596.1 ABC transporter ATP-binding protein [Thermus scotoductus]RTI42464.1 ABC transporter ATP-binding protein [Thermus scotoductus]WCM39637.1 ATP-binding cassette domain-containing protein [Thermus antranikianii]